MLRAENLVKRFGGVHAVRDVALEVASGTVHSIIGPNGAGKTTLLNLLSGITRADSGRIHFEARELTRCRDARIRRRRHRPHVPEPADLLQHDGGGECDRRRMAASGVQLLSALLRTPSRIRAEREARAEAQALLEFVGLARWADADADSLPYGALKRLEIARALAGRPKLLLLR